MAIFSTKSGPIGLDVGRRRIKAAQFHRDGRVWRLAVVADFPRGQEADAVTAEEAAAIRKQLTTAGFVGNNAVVAMPGSMVMTGIMELPPRESGVPIEQLARREMGHLHRRETDAIEVACWDLPRPARAANVTFVMGVACTNDSANQLLDAFEAGGLHVSRLDVHSCTAARACRPALMAANGSVGIMDVAWSAGKLVLWHQGAVVYDRSLSRSGLNVLAAAAAAAAGGDAAQAEAALFREGVAPSGADIAPGSLAAIAEEWLQSLVDEMQIPLSYLGNQYPDSPMQKLLLIGGGAMIPNLAQRLSETLQLPVQAAAPADVADCATDDLTRAGPGATLAVGLAQPV